MPRVQKNDEEDVGVEVGDTISYTAVLITQGKHRFFTVAMPSNILAETCFVDPRDENPEDGFQRHLDEKRAKEIADLHRLWARNHSRSHHIVSATWSKTFLYSAHEDIEVHKVSKNIPNY